MKVYTVFRFVFAPPKTIVLRCPPPEKLMSSPSTAGISGRDALSSPVTVISNSTASPKVAVFVESVLRTFDSACAMHSGSSSARSTAR